SPSAPWPAPTPCAAGATRRDGGEDRSWAACAALRAGWAFGTSFSSRMSSPLTQLQVSSRRRRPATVATQLTPPYALAMSRSRDPRSVEDKDQGHATRTLGGAQIAAVLLAGLLISAYADSRSRAEEATAPSVRYVPIRVFPGYFCSHPSPWAPTGTLLALLGR